MLTPSELLLVAEGVSEIWEEFEEEALKDLAERLWANQGWSATSASRYESLQEMNLYYGYIQKKIAEKLNISEQAVRELMQNAIETSISRDNMIYEEAYSLDLIPNFTPKTDHLNPIITQGIRATNNEIRNFARSYAGELNKTYQHYLDLAYLNTQSGLMSSKEAAQYSIQQLINLGVTVTSPNGRKEKPETIVKRAIRTGINQTASKCQEENFFKFGGTLVEVSSHLGARPSHAVWQGGIYEWVKAGEEKKTDYSDFILTTGYGTGAGLCGWNCRHSFFPFFEGISERAFEQYDLKENEEIYNLQQEQKYNERMIRKYRSEAQVLEAGNMDSSDAKKKVKYWSRENRKLINAHSDVLKKDYTSGKIFSPELSFEERKVLTDYISSYSYKINDQLRRKVELTEGEIIFVNTLNSALDKISSYQGNVVRDLNFTFDEDLIEFIKTNEDHLGKTIDYSQFVSSTKNATYHDTLQVRMFIKSRTGKDVSLYNKGENEILFKYGTKFKVLEINKKTDIIEIKLEEDF